MTLVYKRSGQDCSQIPTNATSLLHSRSVYTFSTLLLSDIPLLSQ